MKSPRTASRVSCMKVTDVPGAISVPTVGIRRDVDPKPPSSHTKRRAVSRKIRTERYNIYIYILFIII
jgi:hypothetical protein